MQNQMLFFYFHLKISKHSKQIFFIIISQKNEQIQREKPFTNTHQKHQSNKNTYV